MKDRPPADLPPRYQALVRIVARYRVMLREVAGALLAPAGAAEVKSESQRVQQRMLGGNALARLAQYGLLNQHREGDQAYPPLPGGVPYFSLTKLGAATAGVPKERAVMPGKAAFGVKALNQHLAALWFTLMCGESGYRLESGELAELLGEHASFRNTAYCLRRESDAWRLYRLYQPETEVKRIADDVVRILAQMRSQPSQRAWLASGDLGLAILAAEPSACSDIREVVQSAGLTVELPIVIRTTPTVESAADLLERWLRGADR